MVHMDDLIEPGAEHIALASRNRFILPDWRACLGFRFRAAFCLQPDQVPEFATWVH